MSENDDILKMSLEVQARELDKRLNRIVELEAEVERLSKRMAVPVARVTMDGGGKALAQDLQVISVREINGALDVRVARPKGEA